MHTLQEESHQTQQRRSRSHTLCKSSSMARSTTMEPHCPAPEPLLGVSALRRSSFEACCKGQKLRGMAIQACRNGPWVPGADWQGHPTHDLWRKANVVKCQTCKAQALHTDGQGQPSKALRGRCGGQKGGQQLQRCLRSKRPREFTQKRSEKNHVYIQYI